MSFRSALPFPHQVIDGLWRDELVTRVAASVPAVDDTRWRCHQSDVELSLAGSPAMWDAAAYNIAGRLSSKSFLGWLATVTGIKGLHCYWRDPGGYWLVPPGGGLGLRCEATLSEDGLYRRLAVMVFLDEPPGDGGDLELWPSSERTVEAGATGPLPDVEEALRIEPRFGRTVILATSATWYGQTRPLAWPTAQRLFVAHYFTVDPPLGVDEPHDTLIAGGLWYPESAPLSAATGR